MLHNPFHRLRREQQRLGIVREMAALYGRPDVHTLSGRYALKLNALAAMCRPADASYLAGAIGGNGLGASLDDLAASVKFERRVARARSAPISFPHPSAQPPRVGPETAGSHRPRGPVVSHHSHQHKAA